MTPRHLIGALGASLAVAVLAGLAAVPAQAAVDVSPAATAFRAGEYVYNDPSAENALSTGDADQLAAQVRDTKLPMFIAVLPESAAGGGTADEVLVELKDEVGLAGIYAVIVGDQFRAGSTSGSAADLATQAFREQREAGPYAVLSAFVTLANERFNGAAPESSGGGAGFLIFLAIAGIVVVVIVVIARRRARARTAVQLASVRAAIDADITEYGERLGAFSLEDPDFDDATRADMQRALDAYDQAKSATSAMRSPADAGSVTSALEDGRYALACVRARLDGQPLPERRPPCFVDPRHGPSVADVAWAPPGLGERDLPLCAACRTSVEAGSQPQGLLVGSGASQQPYWQAGPEYRSYAAGYYSPFGTVMTGALVGTMLGGMWAAPAAAAAPVDSGAFGSGGGFGSFGGGGGGDFGGGDFGGGDFGGGGDF